MKKICVLLCCLLMLQLFSACGKRTEELQQPTRYYYTAKSISYNTADGVIQSEVREAVSFSNNLSLLLEDYLKGPNSPQLQSLIPVDTALVSCAVVDDIVLLTLSDHFSTLSGVKLSVATSAILMTIYDYSGLQELHIQVENGLIDDQTEIVVTMDGILLMDSIVSGE